MIRPLKKVLRKFRGAIDRIVGRPRSGIQLRPNQRLIEVLGQCFDKDSSLTFVKAGANDGVTGDPCGDLFLRDRRWNGVLIEPVPWCLKSLRAVYQDNSRFSVQDVAIGHEESTAIFYCVDEAAEKHLPGLPYWHNQIGSFRRQHIVSHFGDLIEPYIREISVRVLPLTVLLESLNVQSVDFLHIDTEGHDLIVLKSLDFTRYTPRVILIEHKHLSDADRAELLQIFDIHRFKVEDLGSDFLAVLQ